MAMSQLKKQLLSMQAQPVSSTYAKSSKTMAKKAPGTNSTSPSGITKKGGAVKYFKPDKTGADRSPQSKSPQRPLKMHGVQFENKTPTGKKAPKGVMKTQSDAALGGKLKRMVQGPTN